MISKYISTLLRSLASLLLLIFAIEAARAQQPLALLSNSDGEPGIRVVIDSEPPPILPLIVHAKDETRFHRIQIADKQRKLT